MSYDTTQKFVAKLGENHDSMVRQWFETNPGQVKFLGDNIDMRITVSIRI
jgi:hypothetical protein